AEEVVEGGQGVEHLPGVGDGDGQAQVVVGVPVRLREAAGLPPHRGGDVLERVAGLAQKLGVHALPSVSCAGGSPPLPPVGCAGGLAPPGWRAWRACLVSSAARASASAWVRPSQLTFLPKRTMTRSPSVTTATCSPSSSSPRRPAG